MAKKAKIGLNTMDGNYIQRNVEYHTTCIGKNLHKITQKNARPKPLENALSRAGKFMIIVNKLFDTPDISELTKTYNLASDMLNSYYREKDDIHQEQLINRWTVSMRRNSNARHIHMMKYESKRMEKIVELITQLNIVKQMSDCDSLHLKTINKLKELNK